MDLRDVSAQRAAPRRIPPGHRVERAMEVREGQKAPDFTLPDQDGAPFTLSAQLGQGPVVVFFYPKDETPVCTKEACAFRDAYTDLVAAGATVVGISSDDSASHKRFAEKHRLTYRLLADVGGSVRGAFGVPKRFLGLSDGRVTYVLDKDGVIRHRTDSALNADKHVDEAVAVVKRLASS
jgi:peroxiredoxin Q/BCP